MVVFLFPLHSLFDLANHNGSTTLSTEPPVVDIVTPPTKSPSTPRPNVPGDLTEWHRNIRGRVGILQCDLAPDIGPTFADPGCWI
jgi:hypothetical protein